MQTGTLQGIRRYPVKSLAGEELAEAELAAGGLPGDRGWAVCDEVRGGIRGPKKIPALMGLRAHYEKAPAREGSSPAVITLPDGTRLESGAPDVAERLTQALGQPVSLWPLLPPDALEHYRRGAPTQADLAEELRAIFGREPDEPLPDLGLFPPEVLEYESRAAAAVLRVTVECPRCVMVTHGFDDLPRDPSVMRSLVREAGGNLGVYATVETQGRLAVGQPLELLD